MYDTILVPTDGSETMRSVANEAIELAAVMDATIHALYVVDVRGRSGVPADRDDPEIDESLEAFGRKATHEITDWAAQAGITVEQAVREGTPHEEIIAYANEIEADSIVMGTHGRTGLSKFLLGSVADRIIRLAEVPVTTVKIESEGNPVLTVADAEEKAREAADEDGLTPTELREEPYRERSTWIVPLSTSDGSAVNVHIEAATGKVRIAHLK